jgi:glucoamylase
LTDPQERFAPGWPGIAPRWTSSAKSGVGTALNPHSRVWYTLSHGILNEIYYPRVDQACTRDLGLLISDGNRYFSEEKRHCSFENVSIAPGVPVYHLTNSSLDGRYRIRKEVFSDPYRHVVLQRIGFEPLQGKIDDYRCYALLAPHLANWGNGNTGWVANYKGHPMLFAQRDGVTLAFACSQPWRARSVGFVGYSDGWQDISQNFRMTSEYTRAENGNLALTGEIDLAACDGRFVLALGFGRNCWEAGQQVLSSLLEDCDQIREHFVRQWEAWHESLMPIDQPKRERDLYRSSMAVLRTHESKDFVGGIIASLSIPWGFNKGDEDLGGYHLVWPRDLVETAGALVAGGAIVDALRVLRYLESTQEADGHWAQNLWLDGRPYWGGIQMDETAFPILLLDLLRREAGDLLGDLRRWWTMIRRAASFIVRNGPVTQQDRWEEDGGYSPFTLAVEVAALLAAADIADLVGESESATFLRETADTWNDSIERWTYALDGDLAREVGVEGYYVRIAPETDGAASPLQGYVPIKNRTPESSSARATTVISPDSLALVRFGLRAPDDPRIVNTIKVLDALLRAKLPQGPCWYRYNGDGYGEHENGSPFDGTGIGRPWPLLAGERAHYELAAGRPANAEALLHVMELSPAGASRLIPEQVWDQADKPDLELFRGKPTGSACPLVWAHAEYIKLRRSLREGRVFDQPPQTVQRYLVGKQRCDHLLWMLQNKVRTQPCGKKLRIALPSAAIIVWSSDGWKAVHQLPTRDTKLGVHIADLPTGELTPSSSVDFTFRWQPEDRWEGVDYTVAIQ